MSAAVELSGVAKTYVRRGRAVPALAGLTLAVEAGEVAALVGPNGAGKTTALRILATLVTPSTGGGRVLGRDIVSERRAVRRAVGVSLGSGRSFYWRLSVLHNLTFFAVLRGVRRSRASHEARRLAAELDIERFLEAPVRQLSRGALARLAVARACLGEPPVLVLDEPFASVDRAGTGLIWNALMRRAGEGRAVVMATHDASVAARCGQVVEVVPGRARG